MAQMDLFFEEKKKIKKGKKEIKGKEEFYSSSFLRST